MAHIHILYAQRLKGLLNSSLCVLLCLIKLYFRIIIVRAINYCVPIVKVGIILLIYMPNNIRTEEAIDFIMCRYFFYKYSFAKIRKYLSGLKSFTF